MKELNLSKAVGKKVEIIGKLSAIPWQHMINPPTTHPIIEYLDLEDGDQLVIYLAQPITTSQKIKVKGKVFKIEGESKRPGKKSDKKYVEYQIIVSEWEEVFNSN